MQKKHPTIGCCGIVCGLCLRFYTDGNSRCPGCGGEGFENKHPPCTVKTCCVDKYKLESCGQCAEYPCQKYENRERVERDSFVTHKRIFSNHEQIKICGIDSFISEQNNRIVILQDMLTNFDDGRSKGYYCLAAALLSQKQLKAAIDDSIFVRDRKKKSKALRAALQKLSEMEGVELSLDK